MSAPSTVSRVLGTCSVPIEKPDGKGGWAPATLCGGPGDELMHGGGVPAGGMRGSYATYIQRTRNLVSRTLGGARVAPAPSPLLAQQVTSGSIENAALRVCRAHHRMFYNARAPQAAVPALPGGASSDGSDDGADDASVHESGSDGDAADGSADSTGTAPGAAPTRMTVLRRVLNWVQLAARRARTAASYFFFFPPVNANARHRARPRLSRARARRREARASARRDCIDCSCCWCRTRGFARV